MEVEVEVEVVAVDDGRAGEAKRWRRAKLGATVDGQVLTIQNPSLKRDLVVPLPSIASVAPVTDDDLTSTRLPARTVRVVPLGGNVATPTVQVLFQPPVRFHGVRLGNEGMVGISKRERRRGLDIEGATLFPDDPAALIAALVANGVPEAAGALAAQIDLVGEAVGADARAMRQASARAAWRARMVMVLALGLYIPLLTAKAVLPDEGPFPWSAWGRLSAFALAGAAVAALVAATWRRRTSGAHPVRLSFEEAVRRSRAAMLRGAVAVAVVVLLAIGLRRAGVPRLLVVGPILGLPFGVLLGWTAFGSSLSADEPADGPIT